MQPRAARTAFFVVVILLVVGLLAGCGGGGEQAEGGSQGGGSGEGGGSEEQKQQGGGGGSEKQNEGAEGEKPARKAKIALGTLDSVAPADDTFTLQPSTEEQGEQPIAFIVRPTTTIIVGNQESELAALQEGQNAKVRYVTVEDENRARLVQVVGE